MALVAGVDIGNSTTEIVIADGIDPVAWDRRPTRGAKGSIASIRAASALLRNIERFAGVTAERVVTASWHPVVTEAATVHEEAPDTGRIQLVSCAQHTVVGNAAQSGRPWDISVEPPDATSIVALVSPGLGYKQAALRINQSIEQGVAVCGVIAANDEAVLIASRISAELPVVDGADFDLALGARLLFLEVRPAGHALQIATDVWALHNLLGTEENEFESLGFITRWVKNDRAAIVGLFDRPPLKKERPAPASVTWASGESANLFHAIACLGDHPVGAVQSLDIGAHRAAIDLWGVDLTDILVDHGFRSRSRSRSVVVASLAGEESAASDCLDDIFAVPVSVVKSEAAAALLGARSTPGLAGNALVLDIGGGTIDLVGDNGISAAGAGELLSTAVAEVLDVPRGAADWIKRGPAQRVESPQVLLNEDGSSNFTSETDLPVPASALGALVTPGPSGLLPFGQDLQPAQWRIIRQSLKTETIAMNVARILRTHQESKASGGALDIVIVGGPAADDELLPLLGRLPLVAGMGRGNVAGKLGHRYAVAYGLTQTAR
jgi:hypothetical protein